MNQCHLRLPRRHHSARCTSALLAAWAGAVFPKVLPNRQLWILLPAPTSVSAAPVLCRVSPGSPVCPHNFSWTQEQDLWISRKENAGGTGPGEPQVHHRHCRLRGTWLMWDNHSITLLLLLQRGGNEREQAQGGLRSCVGAALS